MRRSCRVDVREVALLQQQAAGHAAQFQLRHPAHRRRRSSPVASTRSSGLAAKAAIACLLEARRGDDFGKLSVQMARALAWSSSRLKAMMPPKAEVGSVR
jgi:hypothetical protein